MQGRAHNSPLSDGFRLLEELSPIHKKVMALGLSSISYTSY
ncbi:hypothetical protein CSC31_4078 [Pseudomonas aeruginosa]|nr:hypothetical protein CSC31_4078 [Pseudomonas aeruginosa]